VEGVEAGLARRLRDGVLGAGLGRAPLGSGPAVTGVLRLLARDAAVDAPFLDSRSLQDPLALGEQDAWRRTRVCAAAVEPLDAAREAGARAGVVVCRSTSVLQRGGVAVAAGLCARLACSSTNWLSLQSCRTQLQEVSGCKEEENFAIHILSCASAM
jgi:hypothetical protein